MTKSLIVVNRSGTPPGKHKCLCVLLTIMIFLCWKGEGFSQNASSSTNAKKHIRLNVIAFGMKNQPRGLQQLKAISEAGHGKFSTADNFQQLEAAFTKVAEDTSTIIVEWPGRDSESSPRTFGHKLSNQPGHWDNPWVKGLSVIRIVLMSATAGIAFVKLRPTCCLHVREPGHHPRKITVHRRSVWLGRDPSCNVVINDPCVSRRHLRITVAKRGANFADNETENGSFMDGKQVKQGFLPFDNRMTIGKTEIQVMKQK